MNPIQKCLEEAEKSSHRPRRPGDYIDESDNLLHCGVCHQPREMRIQFPDKKTHVVGITCSCDEEAKAERKQREQESRTQRRISQMRNRGITDSRYAGNRFVQDMDPDGKVAGISHRYVEAWDLMQEGNHGILFYGPPGTGKTFYACCIANELIDKGIFALVTSIPRILGFQGGYEAEAAMRSELATADLLIIDDLGAERDTSYADEKVFDIIDLRYRAKKPLIVTTNLSIKEMEEAGIQKRRIYDRVQEMCNIRVQIDGPSIRTQVAKQKRQEAQKILSNRKAGEHERPSKT